jgi:O-antigen ligase
VRHEGFYALGAPLVALLAFATSYLICIDRYRAYQLLRVISWSGVAYAVLGIALFIIDPTKVLWREKIAYTSSLTATFINRNTAGVYFGSCAAVCCALLLQQLDQNLSNSDAPLRQRVKSAIRKDPRELTRLLIMMAACLTAMLMTGSRAGIVFSLIGLIAGSIVFFRRRLARSGNLLLALLVAGVGAITFLQVLGGEVSQRFNENGLSDPARLQAYRSTLRMIADHPWFGTGLGSFEWAFPAYRSADAPIWGVWNRTHDTLLEIAAEMGIPMALAVAALWFLILFRLWQGIRVRKRGITVLATAISVATISLLHSTIDFSLQIPGYAIVIFALIGAGVAQSYPSGRQGI